MIVLRVDGSGEAESFPCDAGRRDSGKLSSGEIEWEYMGGGGRIDIYCADGAIQARVRRAKNCTYSFMAPVGGVDGAYRAVFEKDD